jgi:hypothetical protein
MSEKKDTILNDKCFVTVRLGRYVDGRELGHAIGSVAADLGWFVREDIVYRDVNDIETGDIISEYNISEVKFLKEHSRYLGVRMKAIYRNNVSQDSFQLESDRRENAQEYIDGVLEFLSERG